MLGSGNLTQRLRTLREKHDDFRRHVILEPRGHDAIVAALLCDPDDDDRDAAVVFFNNRGYLGMCGHGAIGVAVTLRHLGRLDGSVCRLQTPAGNVDVELLSDNRARVRNVESYRLHRSVSITTDTYGTVVGDIAYGGNWFFLVSESPVAVTPKRLPVLTDLARQIAGRLAADGKTGVDEAPIDHVELFGPPTSESADSRNFVLCPGGQYDRSPCGTGTSAKLACLAADGKLQPGQTWRQESIVGSIFEASYEPATDGRIRPMIVGDAYVCAVGELIREATDPFSDGIDWDHDG